MTKEINPESTKIPEITNPLYPRQIQMPEEENFDDYLINLNIYLDTINKKKDRYFHGLPKPEFEQMKKLRRELRHTLTLGGWSADEIEGLFAESKEIQNQFELKYKGTEKDKSIRKNGQDPAEYHMLWPMIALAYDGHTSPTLMRAVLYHDVEEDLPEYWEEIKDKLPKEVLDIVNAVTKVSNGKTNGKKTEETKQEELSLTEAKIYAAADETPMAIFAKFNGDVRHNNAAGRLNEAKVTRTLSVFDDLHPHFGHKRVADENAYNAWRQINSEIASEVEQLQDETIKKYNISKDDNMKKYQTKRDENIFTMLSDHLEVLEGEMISRHKSLVLNHPTFVTTELPNPYRIVQRMGQDFEARDTLPFIKITCETSDEADLWQKFLEKSHGLAEEQRGKAKILCLKINNAKLSDLSVEVQITTIENEITPADLLRPESTSPLTEEHKLIAEGKLHDIQDTRRDAVEREIDPSSRFAESLGGDKIIVFTPGGKKIKLPSTATPYDAVVAIGPKLAAATLLTGIMAPNGEITLIPKGSILPPGVTIVAITQEMLDSNEILENTVNMQLEHQVNLQEEFEKSGEITPETFELVTTDTALALISKTLSEKQSDPEILKAARIRGRKIIAFLYQQYEQKNRRLDQFVEDGYSSNLTFTNELLNEFGESKELLEQIGMLPLPLREEFKKEWLDPSLLKWSKAQKSILEGAEKWSKNLIEFRRSLYTIKIQGVANDSGVLKRIFEILDSDYDIFMRAGADNLNDRSDKPTFIELVFRKIAEDKVPEVMKLLDENFGKQEGVDIKLILPQSKNQGATIYENKPRI